MCDLFVPALSFQPNESLQRHQRSPPGLDEQQQCKRWKFLNANKIKRQLTLALGSCMRRSLDVAFVGSFFIRHPLPIDLVHAPWNVRFVIGFTRYKVTHTETIFRDGVLFIVQFDTSQSLKILGLSGL